MDGGAFDTVGGQSASSAGLTGSAVETSNVKGDRLEAAIKQQEQLLSFLLNPSSYPHGPSEVQLVQTHSSFVFLAGPFVYKIKKAVDFGFLNFSTLEKRRYACEKEVQLNRRLCPRMYLGIVPVCREGRGYKFGTIVTLGTSGQPPSSAGERRGTGSTLEVATTQNVVVEYAVKMRRLPDGFFLNQLVERGALKPEDLDRIAERLRQFYQTETTTPEIEAWGRVERLKISTDENFQQTEAFIGRTLSRETHNALRFYTGEFYARRAELFERRLQEGWIRDGHGDLHLDHIHLTPQALHIYDCIEFSDRLRYVDVANDIAFLGMDLDYKDRPDLARHFTEHIAALLVDRDMSQLIDFYKCYRAYVRGKVESLHSEAHAAPESEREASAASARSYFRLALQYPICGLMPMVIVVMGRIGSGKSTLARALASELGWFVYSSDRIRKELAGVPVFQRGPPAARARFYTARMTAQTYAKLLSCALQGLEHGRNVILDATYGGRVRREQFVERLTSRGIAYRFIEADAPDSLIRERLASREGKQDEASDARLEDFEMLAAKYQPPTELPPEQLLRIDTDKPSQALAEALQGLVQKQLDEICRCR